MSINEKSILIISDFEDYFAKLISSELLDRDYNVFSISSKHVGDQKLEISQNQFYFNNFQINGIIYRTTPRSHFSGGFVIEDKQFVDTEIRSILISAIALETILTINNYSAEIWFENLNWTYLRYKIITTSQINVAPIFYGSDNINGKSWLPYTRFSRQIIKNNYPSIYLGAPLIEGIDYCRYYVYGFIFDIDGNKLKDEGNRISKTFQEYGVNLCQYFENDKGELILVNPLPFLEPKGLSSEIIQIVVGEYHDRFNNW